MEAGAKQEEMKKATNIKLDERKNEFNDMKKELQQITDFEAKLKV